MMYKGETRVYMPSPPLTGDTGLANLCALLGLDSPTLHTLSPRLRRSLPPHRRLGGPRTPSTVLHISTPILPPLYLLQGAGPWTRPSAGIRTSAGRPQGGLLPGRGHFAC